MTCFSLLGNLLYVQNVSRREKFCSEYNESKISSKKPLHFSDQKVRKVRASSTIRIGVYTMSNLSSKIVSIFADIIHA